MQLPPFHLWVTTCSFTKFVGIIGTDILTELGAVINCSGQSLTINVEGKKEEMSLRYVNYVQGFAKMHALSPAIKKRKIRKANQVIVKQEQTVPPWSHRLITCYLRGTPWLNASYFIEANTLLYDGVVTGSAWVKLRADGSFPVPIINMTPNAYTVRPYQLIGLAYAGFYDAHQSAQESFGDLEDNQGQNERSSGERAQKTAQHEAETHQGRTRTSQSLCNRRTQERKEETGKSKHVSSEVSSDPARAKRVHGIRQGTGHGGGARKEANSQVLERNQTPIEFAPSSQIEWRGKRPGTPLLREVNENDVGGDFEKAMRELSPKKSYIDMNQALPSCANEHSSNNREASRENPSPSLEEYEYEDEEEEEEDYEYWHEEGEDGQEPQPETAAEEWPEPGPSNFLSLPSGEARVITEGEEQGYQEGPANVFVCNYRDMTDDLAKYMHQQQEARVKLWEEQLPPLEDKTILIRPPESSNQPRDESLPAGAARLQDKFEAAVAQAKISAPAKGKLKNLLNQYHDVFRTAGDPTASCPLFEQAIPLIDNTPVCIKQYPLPRAAREALKDRMNEFLQAGIVKPSNSGYNSPVWMVPKKDGTWRMCVDFRELNKKIVHDPFPMPRINDLIEEFHGVKYLSTLDLFWGFYHVKVKDEDTHKLAFTTDEGRFEYVQLPMGLKTSPAVFQRMMNMVFQDYANLFLLVYMDDIMVYSKSEEEHFEHLNKLFKRMQQAGLKLKIEKCHLFQTEVKFLGTLVSREGMRLDPSKVIALQNYPRPDTDLSALQGFLGLVGYFRRHIKDYSKIAKPLYDMFKGEECHVKKRHGKNRVHFKKNQWGEKQEAAFRKLIEAATTAPLLTYPDWDKPFILTTDASAYALGFVLTQEHEDGEHPVAFGSRLLKGAELNYSNTDREMLAVVTGIKHYRQYLYGKYFKVRTDHQAIVLINKGEMCRQRVCKWILELQDYNFDIEYVSATKIKHADALSRIRVNIQDLVREAEKEPTDKEPECRACKRRRLMTSRKMTEDEVVNQEELSREAQINMYEAMDEEDPDWVPVLDFSNWAQAQKSDKELREKFAWVVREKPSNYAISDGILYHLVDKEFVPIVPEGYQKYVISLFHGPPACGHQGTEKVYSAMKGRLFWPGMKKDIQEYIDACDLCQRHKRSYVRVPMQKHTIPPWPFHTVSMDLIGPVTASCFDEKYILVIQDMLTRWTELVPLKETDTATIMRKFMTVWVCRYGPPYRLLTDRGANLISAEARAYCRFFGIEKIHTTAYRPQSNGANERMHAEVAKYLAIYLEGEDKTEWRWLLKDAQHAYNTAYNSALQASPYEVLFGQVPPGGPLGIPTKITEDSDFQKYYGVRRKQLLNKRKAAQVALDKAQEKNLRHFNKHCHKVNIQVGDYVYYKNHAGKNKKFTPKYTGPWKVLEQISPVVFEIELDGYRFSAHASYLKKYRGDQIPREPHAEDSAIEASSDSDSESEADIQGELIPSTLPGNNEEVLIEHFRDRSPTPRTGLRRMQTAVQDTIRQIMPGRMTARERPERAPHELEKRWRVTGNLSDRSRWVKKNTPGRIIDRLTRPRRQENIEEDSIAVRRQRRQPKLPARYED